MRRGGCELDVWSLAFHDGSPQLKDSARWRSLTVDRIRNLQRRAADFIFELAGSERKLAATGNQRPLKSDLCLLPPELFF
jgi:hypothetical protein